MTQGSQVFHPSFGSGTVLSVNRGNATVQFSVGNIDVNKSELQQSINS